MAALVRELGIARLQQLKAWRWIQGCQRGEHVVNTKKRSASQSEKASAS